jgi:bifunctional non-homologous end joining protein LigD
MSARPRPRAKSKRAPANPDLSEYVKKRDFAQTPEPQSSKRRARKGAAPRFVVQMHRASHLHFDFRLEAGGTLKSWAVPKGPSMDPADKRLAMRVEDHPLDYASFEGQIPAGNYGAGQVIVWDEGTYGLFEGDDPAREIERGSVKLVMHGHKLRGNFALVKIRSRDGSDDAWLLIKERDKFAKPGATRRDDRSVLTKRTLDQIAADPRAKKWQSNRASSGSRSTKSRLAARVAKSRRQPEAIRLGPPPATVEIKRPEKILFPKERYTKADLAGYYAAIADTMLPYLEGRPLSLQRYPDGIDGMSFFEKNVGRGAPDWLKTVVVSGSEDRASVRYIVCDDRQTLAYLANLAAITLHVWTSRVGSLDEPDFVFFDLDPGDKCPLRRLAAVALGLRDLLVEIGLAPLVKSSGGSGLHVLVPLGSGYGYDVVKTFGEVVARRIIELMPDDVSLERSTRRRPDDTVYFDFVQIGRGKTMVAPYSVRAFPGAPVSMPLDWRAIEKAKSSRARDARALFLTWTIKTVPALLKRRGDPWKGAARRPRSLESAVKTLRAKWR